MMRSPAVFTWTGQMPRKPGTHKPMRRLTERHGANDRWGSGRGGRPWRRQRARIFERDDYLCQIHLRRGEIRPVTLHGKYAGVCDHIIPLAEGGTDDDDNLQTICQECDKEKTAAEAARGAARNGGGYVKS